MKANKVKGQNFSFNSDGELQTNSTNNLICSSEDYSTEQTETIFLTPPTGKQIIINAFFISTSDESKNVEIKCNGSLVLKLYTTKTTLAGVGNLHVCCGLNNSLRVTCGAGTFVGITYNLI